MTCGRKRHLTRIRHRKGTKDKGKTDELYYIKLRTSVHQKTLLRKFKKTNIYGKIFHNTHDKGIKRCLTNQEGKEGQLYEKIGKNHQ